MQGLDAFIPWLVTLASVVAAILVSVEKLRWSDQYKAAHDEAIKSKDAHIALLQETLRSSQTAAEERLKAKDDRIEHLKSQAAPTMLSVLNAQQELREQVITVLQTQLAESQESHADSEREVDALRDQLFLAQTTLAALEQAATAIRTESRSVPLTAVLAAYTQVSAAGSATAPPLPIRVEIDRAAAAADDKDEPGAVD